MDRSHRNRWANFLARSRGAVAVEFGIIAPMLVVLLFGSVELSMRMRAVDEAERYTYQLGDFISRDTDVVNAEMDLIFDAATDVMPYVGNAGGNIEFRVSSIGFDAAGDRTVLWSVTKGGTSIPETTSRTEGMGEDRETVLKVDVRIEVDTPFAIAFSNARLTKTRTSFFRPRATRAISYEGSLCEQGVQWGPSGTYC